MKFVFFDDTTPVYETVFFPKVYSQFCPMPNEIRPYILEAKAGEDFTVITLAGAPSPSRALSPQLNPLPV
jgi:hypothetical protein